MTDAGYTMEEAAQLVPCSRRWLQTFIRDNPADRGRDAAELNAITDAIRQARIEAAQ